MRRSFSRVPSHAAGAAQSPRASLTGGSDHARAVANSLALADEVAAVGDYDNALSWLHMLDAIGEEIPANYLAKRQAWANHVIQAQMSDTSEATRTCELPCALDRLVRTGRRCVGARYAALMILDPQRLAIEYFITSGITSATRAAIGAHPRGRGVLGQLLLDPQPLRLADLSSDPRCYGFPANHPRMSELVGVPVLIDGEPCGNFYLADKQHGPFTDVDEHTASTLALTAATIVQHAREEEPQPAPGKKHRTS